MMAPTTVGTSSSEKTMLAPKASASTDRSIMLTAAAESTRSATAFMPRACRSLLQTSSRTDTSSSWALGKDKMGRGFLTGEAMVLATQLRIFIVMA